MQLHGPRREGSIPFGRSMTNGRMFEPREVPLGNGCGCVCPACGEAIISKHCMAGKIAPHFAHAPGADCALGYETALHLAAKQLIADRGTLYGSVALSKNRKNRPQQIVSITEILLPVVGQMSLKKLMRQNRRHCLRSH